MAKIKRSNNGGRVKVYSDSSKRFIGLPNNNTITTEMLRDFAVNIMKLDPKIVENMLPLRTKVNWQDISENTYEEWMEHLQPRESEADQIKILGGTRTTYGAAALSGTDKWYGGVLGPDGKIYGIPSHSTDIYVIGTFRNNFSDDAILSTFLNKL